MTNDTQTRKRRSKYQMIASRKLPYSLHAGGDGTFVVLSRCTGATHRRWRYWLFETDIAATGYRATLDKNGCHNECKGKHEHTHWRLMPWDAPPPRHKPDNNRRNQLRLPQRTNATVPHMEHNGDRTVSEPARRAPSVRTPTLSLPGDLDAGMIDWS
jgi:hypothetical protein